MKPFLAPLIALALSGLSPAAAEVVHDASSGLKSVEFLDGWRLPNGNRMAAARIRLEDGWKTYWRAPGGIGIPATFDWTGSRNLSGVRFHWPTPTVFREDGLVTIGYKHELVLPIELTAADPGKPIDINTTVEFAVCDDVCLPASARISAVLATDAEVEKEAISAALGAVPATAQQAGITRVTCGFVPVEDGFEITAQFSTRSALSDLALTVIEYPHADVWIDSAETVRAGTEVTVTSMLYSYSDTPLVLDRSKMRLTVLDQGTAVDIQGCPGS